HGLGAGPRRHREPLRCREIVRRAAYRRRDVHGTAQLKALAHMSEAETLFAALRQSSGDDVVAMLERMVRDAPDHALNKINALDLAAKEGIGEEDVIAVLLTALRLGL